MGFRVPALHENSMALRLGCSGSVFKGYGLDEVLVIRLQPRVYNLCILIYSQYLIIY